MDQDLQTLENELIGEIAEETGVKKQAPQTKREEGLDDGQKYLSSVRERLEEVLDPSENKADIDGIVEEFQERLANGESLEDLQDEFEESIKDFQPEANESDESADYEEVVPKSKYERDIKKLKSRLDNVWGQLKAQNEKAMAKGTSSDDALERMSKEDLENLYDDLELGIIEGEFNGQTLDSKGKKELVKARRKVSDLISSADTRFEARKFKQLEKVLPHMEKVIPDIVDQIRSKKGELFNTAMRLHNSSTSLQRSETGYAEAFAMAIEHVQALPSKSQENLKSMKSRMNRLKSKMNLATPRSRGEIGKRSHDKLFDAAKEGGADEQVKWILETQVKPSMGR